jgi:hypothetical protein
MNMNHFLNELAKLKMQVEGSAAWRGQWYCRQNHR